MTLLEQVGLEDKVNFYVDGLSRGMKQRLCLARALIHDPSLLVMDEPTSGLDPRTRFEFKEILKELREQGKTLILASHDMAEVESLCDRIGILTEGKIAFTGTVGELHEKVGKHYHISVRTAEGSAAYETDNIRDTLFSLLVRYRESGTDILEIRTDRGSLEQHFMKIAKGG